ncbi:XrtA/PEP-CTERM system histidine kinase PrsK [Aromatoleum diolicum]|uniref:histidine kinase n=1 Tax=Aromatoleum diolicum TaxID=75796 RepID=A0ABX1QG33_9RHOO|nr:XrtA/PEP-CTERM system histidine kinase PrsK [Aromatoleum diolicum]NMG76307.1 PEP-CTERM system histidine kinase PrsK [Aromatoleum diolicum]
MGAELSNAAGLGYGVASGAYVLFGVYLLHGWRGGVAGGVLLVAVASSALWALASTFVVANPAAWISLLGWVLDILRQVCWLGFLLILLQPLGAARRRWPVLVTTGVLLAELLAVVNAGFDFALGEVATKLLLGSFLGGAVLGLVLVEQLFRGMPGESRWGLKPLCLALSAGYIFELYLFADGFLFGRLDADVWGVRGVAHALTIPLIALSAGRNPAWTLHITVSREMVFHSTALALSGLYLLVIAGAGYYVRYVGGDWGRALQLALLFAGLLLLGVFLFSGAQRARLRVFLNKHLFPYRYDYRNEWLRFTQAMSAAGGTMDLGQSVIKALSDLVESSGGALWLRDSGGRYSIHARLNQIASDAIEDEGSAFCRFLDEREWIINLEEFRARPGLYEGLTLPEWLSSMPDAWLVLPLKSAGALVGFAVLNAPRTPFEVNWEVLDLLKTAQRQAASYLARMQAAEALLESRKFDSFNRMSAFVVHDLKNLVAQLSLMLKNAERHKHNPEFQEDMLATVAHVESRMRALMAQLQEKRSIDPPRRVEVGALIGRVQVAKRHHRPQVEVDISDELPIEVLAHPERLERVIGHLVQNALDATPEDGSVVTRVARVDGDAVRVLVEDNGCGMTKEFIRERLSKPFQTSKAGGMGLGVFEAQQYIHELGGRLLFDSEPGRGTRVTVTLPAAVRGGGS